MFRKLFITSILVLGLTSLTGCMLRPYRVDVQQGNVLEQSAVNKLKIGMNKHEVEDLLGTPVLTDSRETDDWSYVYTNQINGGKITQQHIDLKFNKDRLIAIKK